jgi:signal transduction histidine kinase
MFVHSLPGQYRPSYLGAAALAVLMAVALLVQAAALAPDGLLAAPFGSLAASGLASILLIAWLRNSSAAMRSFSVSAALAGVFKPGETIQAALGTFAEMLRNAYSASACIVVMYGEETPSLYLAAGPGAAQPKRRALDADSANALLSFMPQCAVLYRKPRWPGRNPLCVFFDSITLQTRHTDTSKICSVAAFLEADSFLSIPLRSRTQSLGRLYLVSGERCYGRRDLRTLAQLAAQAGPSIESMELVQRLADTVATQERKRISRDLHDGTVQPYIGLKLGLEALRRRLEPGDRLAAEFDELIRMAGHGIGELRQYVGRLKEPTASRARRPLVQALRHEVRKFGEFYDFQVDVVAQSEIPVSPQLYEEVLQMVREALSNVRRHAGARGARVELAMACGSLLVKIANQRPLIAPPAPFHPRSIAERAQNLGGRLRVTCGPGETVVAIEIPF